MMGWCLLSRSCAAHLPAKVLARLVDQELPLVTRLIARRHLSRCPECRAKYKVVWRTARLVREYRRNLIATVGQTPAATRNLFIRKLDAALESMPERTWWTALLEPAQFQLRLSAPAITSALIITLACATLSFVYDRRISVVSAAEFLNRAVAADVAPATVTNNKVVYRHLRIKTNRRIIDRAICQYDCSERPERYSRGNRAYVNLAARLALAGVSWDEPLSAVSFKAWHDRQVNPRDEIRSSKDGLLTIRTHITSSNVEWESFTVERQGFHAVERTIAYRNLERVSISEISRDALSPNDQSFLEPSSPNHTVLRPASPGAGAALMPSPAQLNETELRTRLLLNEASADTGEEIEISRDRKEIRVQGLVESEERKQELSTVLHGIPFLAVKIRSFDDLKSAGDAGTELKSTVQQSVAARVSPLEQYLVAHNRTRDDLSRISAGLFNCSLSINRLSRSVDRIDQEFSGDAELTPLAAHDRDELLSRNIASLLEQLQHQEQLLDETGIDVHSQVRDSTTSTSGDKQMSSLSEMNMRATRELISGSDESSRTVNRTAGDLIITILQLRNAAMALLQSHHTQP